MRQERMEQEAKEQELDTVFEVGVLGSEVRPACVAAQCLLIPKPGLRQSSFVWRPL